MTAGGYASDLSRSWVGEVSVGPGTTSTYSVPHMGLDLNILNTAWGVIIIGHT